MKAPTVNFDAYKDMAKKTTRPVAGFPGWVVYRDRRGFFSVKSEAQVGQFFSGGVDPSGRPEKREPPPIETEEPVAPSVQNPVQENPKMARNRYDDTFDYYEQEMAAYGPTMDLPVNQRNNPKKRKASKKRAPSAWNALFGQISRRAKDIQVAKNCAWGIAWNQARAEIQGGKRAAANPWRLNAGRHIVKGKQTRGHSSFYGGAYQGARSLSSWTKDELVRSGSSEAVAELRRRGRDADGVKLAWKQPKKAKMAANNPWGWNY